ncbi:uncharacterized protein PITG_08433 [Phytophthora infestans T30-4]|uniref:Uncharacterized protein n=1 Tax=Phytophthora infestans (strain T30-4) TaxID=403677 RepID=D0NAL3_PHYIT|nr:uncharacterized protein PITG_08433 [Phytophthora infestans T30-4]EEY54871.1 conserved hypothetical protein [Phytophthora infestans T30-4]|eukprot:XP_002903816.1 conserved hypothetical protein [Phytophthora infestans T30-4]
MCRSANAFGIRHSHIEWRGDALRVYFAHMKKDQGEIYWATSTFDMDIRLFPGSDEYERFGKRLHCLLEDAEVSAELKRRGVSSSDIGTQSMRKGAATNCVSGSTACPSSTAVPLRRGYACWESCCWSTIE